MTTPSSVGSPSPIRSFVREYVSPAISAGAAIVPCMYGFVLKSFAEIEQQAPKMSPKELGKLGIKSAPTITLIVGGQVGFQTLFEKHVSKNAIVSSVVTAAVTTPGLIVFNGFSLNQSVMETIRKMSLRQGMYVFGREVFFLGSLRISGPITEAMKGKFGDNAVVSVAAPFFSGALGSVIGHPFDAAATRLQKGLKVTLATSFNGAIPKAIACGVFTVLFRLNMKVADSVI